MILRILLAVFVFLHGAGHVTWFLAAFVPKALRESGKEDALARNIVARRPPWLAFPLGILALVVAGGFVVTGIAILGQTDWWRLAGVASVSGSVVVAAAWWNPSGATSVLALLADAGLFCVMFVPALSDFFGL